MWGGRGGEGEWAGGAPASDAVVSGTNTSPIPRPISSIGPKTADQYPVAGVTRDSQAIEATTGSIPAIISGFAPSRGISLGASPDAANSATVIGRNATPPPGRLKPMLLSRKLGRR